VLAALRHQVLAVVPDVRRGTDDDPRLPELDAERSRSLELGHRGTGQTLNPLPEHRHATVGGVA